MKSNVWAAVWVAFVLSAGCSSSGSVKSTSDETDEDSLFADVIQDGLLDGQGQDLGDKTSVDPDGLDVGQDQWVDLETDQPSPDVIQPPQPVGTWYGLVPVGGQAVSGATKLWYRLLGGPAPVRASSSNYNFFGGLLLAE